MPEKITQRMGFGTVFSNQTQNSPSFPFSGKQAGDGENW